MCQNAPTAIIFCLWQANIIKALNGSTLKRKCHVDNDKIAVLNAWRRIDCRTRDAFRRSYLPELIEGFEVHIYIYPFILYSVNCNSFYVLCSEDQNICLALTFYNPTNKLVRVSIWFYEGFKILKSYLYSVLIMCQPAGISARYLSF